MNNPTSVFIREYQSKDREAVRRIARETALLELNSDGRIFDNPELVSDVLTLYFTDYEPHSCFVAEDTGKVIGYLIGSLNVLRMQKIIKHHIVPKIIGKILKDLSFIRKGNFVLFFQIFKSLLKGEFLVQDFSSQYPATLHINIEKDYRANALGSKLIQRYLNYLKTQHVGGVHLSTYSAKAKNFFEKMDFHILYTGKRSYLKPYCGHDIFVYILGKSL